jgi:O-antigen ligase
MFALPPIVAIILLDYLRPQAYVQALENLPLLYIFSGLALLGFVLDLRMRLSQLAAAPQLGLVAAFMVWIIVTVAVNAPGTLAARLSATFIPLALYVLVGHAVQTFRSLEILVGVMLITSILIAVLGVHQGLAPWGCHQRKIVGGEGALIYDGRECEPEQNEGCAAEGAEPGADYRCERVGLFGTQSDHGRVRYIGTLNDPNDLSLALAITLPFAFAFFDRRPSSGRLLLLIASCLMVGLCSVFTQSRGGQIVFMTVLGVYFIRRYGIRGVIIALLFAVPILAFGGRSDAEDSTIERTECWYVGIRLFTSHPLFGVGSGQFTAHHYLTAHNAYVLTSAELGEVGMLLWSSILYVSARIPIAVLSRRDSGHPPVASAWATSMLAAMAGLLIGIFFLSWTYKDFLWIYVGLTGALYQAIRRHDPTFEVRFGWRDFGLVFAFVSVLQIWLWVYTRLKVG